MSHTFWTERNQAPTYEFVLSVLEREVDELTSLDGELEEGEGPWAEGHRVYIWQDGVSTRPIGLSWEDGEFSARILALSCPEDYRLALDAVCAVAQEANTKVQSEDGDEFAPEDREQDYGSAWIDEHVTVMIRMMLAKRPDEETPATNYISGPTRTFELGPRMQARLEGLDETTRQKKLFEAMRALFYPDTVGAYGPSVFVRPGPDGGKITYTAWGPGVTYHFPPLHELMLFDEEPRIFPYAKLEALVGSDEMRWIDDSTVRIEAIHDDQWTDFVKRARAIAQGESEAPAMLSDATDDEESVDASEFTKRFSVNTLIWGIAILMLVTTAFIAI